MPRDSRLLGRESQSLDRHVGPHDDIDVSYGAVGSWIVSNALAVAGRVCETYLVGPRDTDDPPQWRTEIGWPVFRMSDGREPRT
ncbi:GyrI-like domain-containing protein [Aeromicrobium duanguangcaii]|uniref:GyrI-like domain-containing protein n=1 Tax=Aeromicrobium duanguangcaii TaxID=2968086 RepID=UPI00201769D8|nr:GyrI-like domain-containing protein [Aeromicrobium duanguangcaii]MCL3836674.1 hypothetical protein [Aeromicrobium duanguangcaii]